ncbi:hypothetical protein FRB96_002128 [Tulasnella sp. 330]|nr:hypothetical protein FRB96_002128 [Tulasnella sp. 330]
MVYAIPLIGSLLLASATFAVPTNLAGRQQRRREHHRSRPKTLTSEIPRPEYSENWAGGVLNSPAGTYKAVTATFVVPTPKYPSGQTRGNASASAWVGIDGDTCEAAILQTGVDFTVDNGVVSYDAWYEWFPDSTDDFTGITFKAGDTVKLTVTAMATTSGTAVIENLTNGKTVTKTITSNNALCGQDAEWIVEDYEENGGLVPFANFDAIEFSGAMATNQTGSVGPGSATVIDINQNNIVLTSTTTNTSSINITYVINEAVAPMVDGIAI